MEKEGWGYFGWQGLGFECPEDWELSTVSGDKRRGGFTLDDGEIIRVEVQWDHPVTPFSLDKVIEKHIQDLQKAAKRKKVPLQIRRKIKMRGKLFREKNGELFEWKADYRVFTLICYCKICGRLLFMELFFHLEEKFEETLNRILSTLKDHFEKEEKWGVYGFIFLLPSGFSLSKFSLKSGYLYLEFRREREFLILERFSLANLLLEKRSLKDWFKEKYPSRWALIEERKERIHECISLKFKERGIRRWKGEGRVWYCLPSNKIYLVLRKSKREISSPWPEIFCHAEKGELS